MFRRLVGGLAVASLLVGVIVVVFWWRSYRHVDRFALGDVKSTRTSYTSKEGRVMVTKSREVGGMIMQQSEFYEHRRLAAACLCVPGFWLAVMVRRKLLPRPGGFPVDELKRRADMR